MVSQENRGGSQEGVARVVQLMGAILLNSVSISTVDGGSRDARVVLLTNALVMVVREMGNGVDRVESARVVPLEHVLPQRQLLDQQEIDLVHNPRLTDLAREAMRSMGYYSTCTSYVADGFVRFVADDVFEVSVWLLDAL